MSLPKGFFGTTCCLCSFLTFASRCAAFSALVLASRFGLGARRISLESVLHAGSLFGFAVRFVAGSSVPKMTGAGLELFGMTTCPSYDRSPSLRHLTATVTGTGSTTAWQDVRLGSQLSVGSVCCLPSTQAGFSAQSVFRCQMEVTMPMLRTLQFKLLLPAEVTMAAGRRVLLPAPSPSGDGVWVMAEPHHRSRIGEVVPITSDFEGHAAGGRGLFGVDGGGVRYLCQYLVDVSRRREIAEARILELRAAEAIEGATVAVLGVDARTSSVSYRVNTGKRHKDFTPAVSERDQIDSDDWPLEGSRTTRWPVENMLKSGAPPLDRHFRWLGDAEISQGDRSKYEYETLSRTLEAGLLYDQLAVCNLASFEILSRRIQLLEQAHLENPSAPDYSAPSPYVGVVERRGGALICPALIAHVAERLKDESAVAKEKRKAAEVKKESRVLAAAAAGNATTPPPGAGSAAMAGPKK